MPKPVLKVVGKGDSEIGISSEEMRKRMLEYRFMSELELEREWYERQAEVDRNRRPVPPSPLPRKLSQREQQIEMFKSTYRDIFEGDARFEKFECKPDPKTGSKIGKVLLTFDVQNAFEELGPLLKLQDTYVRVFLGGTQVSVKDLD